MRYVMLWWQTVKPPRLISFSCVCRDAMPLRRLIWVFDRQQKGEVMVPRKSWSPGSFLSFSWSSHLIMVEFLVKWYVKSFEVLWLLSSQEWVGMMLSICMGGEFQASLALSYYVKQDHGEMKPPASAFSYRKFDNLFNVWLKSFKYYVHLKWVNESSFIMM